MPRSKGTPKTGGRVKGSPCRTKREVSDILADLKFDPIQRMVYVANHPKASLDLQGKMSAELAKYEHAQKRAIEHSGPAGGPVPLTMIIERTYTKS